MVGTRGVPAAYGGFETAIEEIGRRLASAGHDVTVYCRSKSPGVKPNEHLGMKLIHLGALRTRSLETLSHTAITSLHLLFTPRHDVVFVFNAANSPFLPIIRRRGVPIAVHVDGLEWKRAKWGPIGKTFYRLAESLSVRWADALIADARGIAAYYRSEFQVDTELISYGAKIVDRRRGRKIEDLGLESGGYHLVVARFERENHVDVILRGYSASTADLPLVVVGSAPYAAAHVEEIEEIARADGRIRMIGGVWDQELLDDLYLNARSYIHGHSVGGTNPSLLRAMGAGVSVIAWDVVFNREILREEGRFFSSANDLPQHLSEAEGDAAAAASIGSRLRDRARNEYDWNEVAGLYGALAERLHAGLSTRGSASGRRRKSRRGVGEAVRSTGSGVPTAGA